MKTPMTEAEFAPAAYLAALRISAQRIAMARAVLVDGRSYAEAVKQYGYRRQTAYAATKIVLQHSKHFQRAKDLEIAAGVTRSKKKQNTGS